MDNLSVPIPSISPQSAVQPTASPSESPNRHWLLWLIGGIALLALGAAIGGFGVKFFSESPNLSQLTSTPTPTLSPIPSPALDLNREPAGSAATADWKTYVSLNDYQIQYPNDWTIETSPEGFSVKKSGYKIVFSFPSSYGPGICIFSDNPDFTKNDPNDPIMMGSKCPGKYTEITGAGFIFRRKDEPNTSPEGKRTGNWSIYVKDKSGHFVTVPPIAYEIPVNNYDLSTIILMDQILSTFHFLK